VTSADLDRLEPVQRTTRDRLLQAAQACFLERGYGQTTTRTIADRAGLTERTLFNLFPSKADLFRDAVAAAVSELDEGGRVRDMPEVQNLGAAPDLAGFLSSFAGTTIRLHQRSAPYAAVALQAAAVDDAAAEIWRWGKHEQERDVRTIVSVLVDHAWLPRSRVDDVVDAVLMLTSHETYAQLCLERGWTENRYTDWLAAHLHLEISRGNDGSP
jgi:AcrR family transcriptional regulator